MRSFRLRAHEGNAGPVAYTNDGAERTCPDHGGIRRHEPASHGKLMEEARAERQRRAVYNGKAFGRFQVYTAQYIEQPEAGRHG